VPFRKSFRPLSGLLFSAGVMLAPSIAAAEPNVVTTIKPVHSLVSGVMEGVGKPFLLIDGAASPHGFALKPSQAFLLQGADIVFWVSHELETSLEKPIESLAEKAERVELISAPGMTLLSFREGGGFEAHDHDHDGDHHDEQDHDEHAKDDHEKDEHEEHAHDDHDKDEHAHEGHAHDEHAGDGKDTHVWLDPENARVMVRDIAHHLIEHDPVNAETYRKNAERMDARLQELSATLSTQLAPAAGLPFIVFHDAYHYFENRFGLTAAGTLTINPEVPASAKRVAEVQHKIQDLNAKCVFSEPQFGPKIVKVVLDGTGTSTAVLDPLGAEIDNGAELYFELLTNLATSFSECLTGS
jgi:zinc transport system substrate-binding protein